MQLGFVIDHSSCIGCHACTVACKAENGVPLGKFRTWVKYTERGNYPDVRRSFAVLRCNQCTNAPCVEICPVGALDKRPDGIVDVDPAACIGCKACMQGCPYDALYLNDQSGTAEKCHFCAHRTERGLAPACAVVCPTEAIVPGDFHDPRSRVSRLRAEHELRTRKPEAGTGPNVHYREVEVAGIDPEQTVGGTGYLWADRLPGPRMDAASFEAAQQDAERRARTTYDVEHAVHWRGKVSAYLFTKSLASGAFLVLALLTAGAGGTSGLNRMDSRVLAGTALFFLLVTTVLLIGDLKRPERFWFILARPNWRSWLTRGSVILTGYGGVLTFWLGLSIWRVDRPFLETWLAIVGAILAALTACYTGWLFHQSKGRVLWLRRGLPTHLTVQAGVAGAAWFLLIAPLLAGFGATTQLVRFFLLGALAVHAGFMLTEERMAPRGREAEYRRATALLARGPFSARHRWLGLATGVGAPMVLLVASAAPAALALAALMTLVGLYVEEDLLVRAGQALSIS